MQQQIVTSGGQARTCWTGEDRIETDCDRQRQPVTGRDSLGQVETGTVRKREAGTDMNKHG
jgi:hypothetical protein